MWYTLSKESFILPLSSASIEEDKRLGRLYRRAKGYAGSKYSQSYQRAYRKSHRKKHRDYMRLYMRIYRKAEALAELRGIVKL